MYIFNLLLAALFRFNFLMRTKGNPIGSARGMLMLLITAFVLMILKFANIAIFAFPIWSVFLIPLIIYSLMYFNLWDSDTIIAFEEDSNNESDIQMANRILLTFMIAPIGFICLKSLLT